MAKSKWDGKIPFDQEGNALSDVRGHGRGSKPPLVWKDNYVLKATLNYQNGANNRLIFEDEKGHTYPMFVSELGRTLRWAQVIGDLFDARWTFRRWGQNFSLRVAPPRPCCRCEEEPSVNKEGWIKHSCSPSFTWPRIHITHWDRLMTNNADWLKAQKR